MLSRTLSTEAEAQACFNGLLRMCPNNKTWQWGTVIYSKSNRTVTFIVTHTNKACERVTIREHIPGVTIDTIEYVVRRYFLCDLATFQDGAEPPSFKLIEWTEGGHAIKLPEIEECFQKKTNKHSEANLKDLAAFMQLGE